ncbi:hypothetical protein LOTGIDRAFT_166422 [Lottia gigantea]|uniref:Uncharacterized protein n=1 Tax=Lottia gigantea TaxID=225164 RepID=V4BF77_LOTGI|nr:hypothetical protein LOTGIDRAFT_166422 [Lottia gigantea]ESO87539.1 hypothetical protein LOTGIDRAFT_166422 [Lottia gigantea]
MNEAICSPPKLRRLVHLDKEFGVVSTTSPIFSPLLEKNCKKLPIPRLKIPDSFNNLPVQSSPLSIPQQSPRRSVAASPLVMAHPITSSVKASLAPVKEIPSSLSMESQIVDGALENVVSLPQMVTDVSLVQKCQSNAISKHMQVLAQLETQVQKEEKKNSEMLLDISSMTKKIYVTEDLVNKKHKSCEVLEEEIEQMVINNSAIEKSRYLKLKEIEKEKSWKYNLKRAVAFNYEIFLDSHSVITDNEIHRNEENSRYIISGEKEEEIKKEIKELQSTQFDLEKQLENADIQVTRLLVVTVNYTFARRQTDQVNKQIDKVQQNINVLHKRNAAQLTRLKRQVKDQQFRHQQWLDQISHLNKIISDLQQQIDEC